MPVLISIAVGLLLAAMIVCYAEALVRPEPRPRHDKAVR